MEEDREREGVGSVGEDGPDDEREGCEEDAMMGDAERVG